MSYPENLKYTKDHEWVKIEGEEAYIGITDFAQKELGDIVFIEVETVDETLDIEEVFGSIEAVKTVSDLFMPLSGEVLEFNEALESTPEIKFKKKTFYRKYQNSSTSWYEPVDTLPGNTINEINQKLEYYFLDNAEEVVTEDAYVMNIPPALSVQFDYPLRRYLFLNGTVIYGFNIGKSYMKRPSILAFTPRYETNRMEISLPISIYEWVWNSPRIGLYFRYGNFFFGFDKLNTALNLNDFTGLDFYMGLKLNLSNNFRMNFIKGYCQEKRVGDIETFDYRNF